MPFSNQNIIVTGGTRGIGAAVSKHFLELGGTVIATYHRNDETALSFKQSLELLGEKLFLKKFDVGDSQAVNNFFDSLESEFQNIHVLINNSGVRHDNLTASMTDDEWQQVINTNLNGTFFMSRRAVLNFMKNRYGRIVNISSVGGTLGLKGQANYAASKAGQIALSKSLSKEVARRNITVNNVCPGFIETELIGDLNDELVREYKNMIPMKRFGTASEVAQAVAFLASKDASYITGATLEITGGL